MKNRRFILGFVIAVLFMAFILISNWAIGYTSDSSTVIIERGVIYSDEPVCAQESLKDRPIHPPELASCKEFVVWQNEVARQLDLPVLTESLLASLATDHELFQKYDLVRLENTKYYKIDRINPRFRIVYRQVAEYFLGLGQRYYQETHKPLELVSGARTLEWYRLMTTPRVNGHRNKAYNPNAFVDEDNPDAVSMHCYMIAIDISCKNMSAKQKATLQRLLLADTRQNRRIQPTEESVRIYKRHKRQRILVGSRVVAYHVVIFNASFLTQYSKPAK